MNFSRASALTAALVALALGSSAVGQSPAPVFTVHLTAPVDHTVKGRLLILAEPVPRAGMVEHVRIDPSPASGSAVAARDVTLAPGQSTEVDGDLTAFPAFSHLKPGAYLIQAALDTHAMAAYSDQVRPQDLFGPVVQVNLPAQRVSLTLDKVQPETPTPWDRATGPDAQAVKAHTERLTLPSKLLTAFWKQPTGIRAYVLTPPNYDQDKAARYPVVFETEGFGATFEGNFGRVQRTYADMLSGAEPPMIWVFIDHAGPTGTNEFADSANNGPWGAALTTEFIPWLDGKYRTDPKNRFTTGHSSGGWASLWLQVAYPKVFAGAWPTSPDPVDFHDFTNINLYLPHPNAYREPDGQPTLLVRSPTAPATFEQYAKSERVLGPVSGQISSFDWVFSPRGPDGKPVPLFNEVTGDVDPKVAAYWDAHYDITAMIKRDWKRLKPDLDGKIHLWVGTLDTYYLDGPAHMLQQTLDQLGAKSEFHFIEGANHGSVMTENGDPRGVERTIAWQMYAVAKPGTKRPAKTP